MHTVETHGPPMGEVLKRARKRAKLTQRELHLRSGISVSSIGRIENCMQEPGHVVTVQLLEACGAGFKIALKIDDPTPLNAVYVLDHESVCDGREAAQGRQGRFGRHRQELRERLVSALRKSRIVAIYAASGTSVDHMRDKANALTKELGALLAGDQDE